MNCTSCPAVTHEPKTLLLSFLTPPIDKRHSQDYASRNRSNPRSLPGTAPAREVYS